MFKFSAIGRITFGLVSIATSLLLIAAMTGLFPNSREFVMRGRSRLCESIAVNFTLLAEKADEESLRQALKAIADRDPDLQSLAVRHDDGSVLFEIGEHQSQWKPMAQGKSTDSQVVVQLYSAGKPWGTIEARFRPLESPGILGFMSRPELIHASVLALLFLLVFYAYLRRVLQQLNPSQVIPGRVRDALDTLAEGLLILDRNERIVLANRAFEKSVGKTAEQLVGKPVGRIPFSHRDDSESTALPWSEALQDGVAVRGRIYGMDVQGQGQRTFSISASPILDEKGSQRGVLASFEDVTTLEHKQDELKALIEQLRSSSAEVKRQNRELEFLATRDPLTGCRNRRSFFQLFDQQWEACKQTGIPLSLIMTDIDHFKSINDNFGHSIGDEVLRAVAGVLLKMTKDIATVCRYGGEEFAILMPATDLDEAEFIAEQARLNIAALEFPDLKTTVSLGVSSTSELAVNPRELTDQADKCLYMAKRRGRNQVVRWGQIPIPDDLETEAAAQIESEVDETEEAVFVPYHAVAALISALAFRDHATAEHSRRVADMCVATAEGLLSASDCYNLEIAALLHDIGKIGVPDAILLKPGPLTEDEWALMRRHDRMGAEIVRSSFGSPSLTRIIENYPAFYADGSQRPDLPMGNRIPVAARILAVADAYDSMVSDRLYRRGRSREEAFAELRACTQNQFDGEIVERFISVMQNRQQSVAIDDVGKETALMIGLQIERLTKALDQQDFDSLTAVSHRLRETSVKHGAVGIAAKVQQLETCINAKEDLVAILYSANELLDLCRSTQRALLASHVPAERTDRERALSAV